MKWTAFIERLFKEAEPYLEVRGDMLHTRVAHERALALTAGEGGDRGIVEPAIVLHDVGWSKVDPEKISMAFGVHADGKAAAREVNRIHEIRGAVIAGRILASLSYDKRLTERIVRIIERHDSGTETDSIEEKLVKDADKLWRYSKRGFWSEIQRQGVDPVFFHERLARRREEWFITPTALRMAAEDLVRRTKELKIPEGPSPEA